MSVLHFLRVKLIHRGEKKITKKNTPFPIFYSLNLKISINPNNETEMVVDPRVTMTTKCKYFERKFTWRNAPIIYAQIHGTGITIEGLREVGEEGLKKGASHNAFDRMICGRCFIKVCTFSPLRGIMIENKNDKYTLLCLKKEEKRKKERNLSNELSISIRTRRQTSVSPRKIFKRIIEMIIILGGSFYL